MTSRTPSRRRVGLIALPVAAALLLAFAPSALADAFSPESGGSPNADDIDTLYWITLAIGIVIFLGVEGTLIWSLIKFRARRRGPEPAMIRGNTPLELSWTAGAALILVVLATITFIFLDDIKDPPNSLPGGLQVAAINQSEPPSGNALNIRVVGRQYLWRYDYPGPPGELFSYYEMVVPVNTTVTLDITSEDVIHSWWIPRLGGKADATPGHNNETWFRISKPGLYGGQCAELCGDNHADMRAQVRALPVDEYEQWAQRQKAAIEESKEQLAITRRQREQRQAQQDQDAAGGQPQAEATE